ncbi:MAG: UvrD-helicase domain-containing protein, partial [Thermoplasmata archaeon]|nr:UvrD-helicase domain-containing protein [Thermoplasmata archaeon]
MDEVMPLKLDEDQMRALQEEGKVILKASAGSGKTTTIVGLYLHLLMKGHKTSEIVAITFTEKAAAELRERIYRAVEQLEGLQGREEVMISLPHAPIGTIHSFCARTLREYPLEASVQPDFRVMEEVESQQVLREAVRAYLDRMNILSMRGEGGEEVEAFRKAMAAMGHSMVEVRRRLRMMVSLGRTF